MKWLSKYGLLVIVLILVVPCALAQRRVACIGDSVTKGYGLKDSSSSYPAHLQTLLGSEYVVGNFGHSGATLLTNGHNPYVKTKAYQEALDFAPDILIVALGLNDTDPRNWPNYRNDFFLNYSQLIAAFKKVNPQVQVFICTMTPIFSGHSRFLSGTREWFDQIQSLIPAIARANNATLIDNHAVLKARFDLFEDYIHPSEAGALLIAQNVYSYLVPSKNKLSVSPTLGSHMVLQRGVENKVFGKADAFETINLSFDGRHFSTKADALGNWVILLPNRKVGGPFTITITGATDEIILSDILFGDVYLASGQSNMAFQLKDMDNADYYVDKLLKRSTVRLFHNHNLVETNHTPWNGETLEQINRLNFFQGQWEVPTASNIKNFSAIAAVFATDLSFSIDVPIGIVQLAVGGSNTESWIPRTVLENDNLLASYLHTWRKSDFIQDFCRNRAAKNLEFATLKNQRHPYEPAYNYEAGVDRWKNTQFSGVLWYQGESNAHNVEHHAYLFEKLIHSWRNSFKQDLPFYFVQLSSINRPSWGSFRDSQRVLSNQIPNVYMVPTYDVGDLQDVHPRRKEIIGQRLANIVKQYNYKVNIQANVPSPIKYDINNKLVTITFNHCKSLKLKSGSSINDLQIMDSKGNIIPITDVVIHKNKISFSIPDQLIRAIQYAYTPFSLGNLVSDTGVPVSTFNINIE